MPGKTKNIALIIHGGAGLIQKRRFEKMRKVLFMVLREVSPELEQGSFALDVVERAVCMLEDHELFNAGFGSALRSDGRVMMDACIMDGNRLNFGAVGAVSRVKNPIQLARRVMEELGSNFLVAEGAERFAKEHRLKLISEKSLISEWRRKQWERRALEMKMSAEDYDNHGTVGAVALDVYGRLASATSTGGIFYAPSWRIGDTPIIGAGTYADNICAVSATGIGEAIMKAVLAKSCADLVANGLAPIKAGQLAISIFEKKTGGRAGVIAVDYLGRIGYAFNSKRMVFGWWKRKEGIVVSE